ncbi:hypothetical protein [Ponticaulis sp.]|uniref:hypothetical protein n=1 Tax=Ponticaulis sp. TaxID=2020902 RepID=UPI000B645756|nr:hypothetical protein [Ponticaulis sp.]MAI90892.1 hypothetical protein [Ponticaulis sp.]OUX98742.1 MAG: hypothetical protein CBB65_10645 [Hyphomonadaceae bacterium TMED5]|tara:strand:- start:43530 stop:43844 length:315 start_codon:yes stop_codon:yes gene_type:complete
MKKSALILALSVTAFITGCSKTDEQVIVQSCIDTDERVNQAYCDCLYSKMEQSMPAGVITNIADAIRDGASDPIDAISTLPANEQMTALPMTLQLLECAAELDE